MALGERRADVVILGGGITGLAAGLASGAPIYEANDLPGGICSSYYMSPGEGYRRRAAPCGAGAYRFEVGGGHWIFGGDPLVLRLVRSMTPVRSYARKSGVYFRDQDILVPYPIQYHLRYLGPKVAAQALTEVMGGAKSAQGAATMADWLRASFGPTLCELFFDPFHQLYTAGLWKGIAPQDSFKSPVSIPTMIQGAFDEGPSGGYNDSFVYPTEGLDTLVRRMAAGCDIHYGERVTSIDVEERAIYFADGAVVRYGALLSTLPLNEMMALTSLTTGCEPDPATSVMVINIGAVRGPRCPDVHWAYVPKSGAGFHRVGFYSNVDTSFLPQPVRSMGGRVGVYVERAYSQAQKPSDASIQLLCTNVVKELQEWGWIGDTEVVDATWIGTAYTWSWPASKWRTEALRALDRHSIYQVGRFARWSFQGIADSMRDGLIAGAALANGRRSLDAS